MTHSLIFVFVLCLLSSPAAATTDAPDIVRIDVDLQISRCVVFGEVRDSPNVGSGEFRTQSGMPFAA